MDILSNHAGYKGAAWCWSLTGTRSRANPGTTTDYHHIHVVYTRQDETGDLYIERLLEQIGKNYAVRVATSDGLIQLSALRAGLLQLSAQELWREVEWVGRQIDQAVAELNRRGNLSAPPKRAKAPGGAGGLGRWQVVLSGPAQVRTCEVGSARLGREPDFLRGELSSEVQHFSRGGKSEALSGSVIEHIHDLGNFLLGDLPEVGTSRKKLTYQAVQVFYRRLLPREWGRVK